jgi:hypothetical protein
MSFYDDSKLFQLLHLVSSWLVEFWSELWLWAQPSEINLIKSWWNNRWWKVLMGQNLWSQLPNEKISSVLEIILGNTLFIAKDKESIAILDNSSMIWTTCWLVQVSNWSRSNSSIHKDNKSMEAKTNIPWNLRWVHNLNHLIKPDPCTPTMWASTNIYYIQSNRDIHKVTLNTFTPKPVFQSQTLLSTKWKKIDWIWVHKICWKYINTLMHWIWEYIVALLHTIIVKLPVKKFKWSETHTTTEFGDN